MYHIVKTKSKKFQVVNIAANGKVINSSEVLNSKQSCHKNIIANMDSVFIDDSGLCYVCVQDDTGEAPIAYTLFDTGEMETDIAARPKYRPGKNPIAKSKKKK